MNEGCHFLDGHKLFLCAGRRAPNHIRESTKIEMVQYDLDSRDGSYEFENHTV